MKRTTKKLITLVLTCVLTICFNHLTFSQTQIDSAANADSSYKPIISIAQTEGTATFFQTFLRTPFVFFSGAITFVSIVFTGVCEVFGYVFSGLDYKFPITKEVFNIGWKGIIQQWWWHPGVTWHLIASLIFWIALLGGGSKKRR